MPISILPSIESLAGLKPLAINGSYNITATGAWQQTIYTVPADQLYLITNYVLYFTSGTGTSLYFQAQDCNGIPQIVNFVLTPTVNYPYTSFIVAVAADANRLIQVGMTVVTQPCLMHWWISGFLFKRGEGVLD